MVGTWNLNGRVSVTIVSFLACFHAFQTATESLIPWLFPRDGMGECVTTSLRRDSVFTGFKAGYDCSWIPGNSAVNCTTNPPDRSRKTVCSLASLDGLFYIVYSILGEFGKRKSWIISNKSLEESPVMFYSAASRYSSAESPLLKRLSEFP